MDWIEGGIDTPPPSPSASSTLIYHRVTVQPHKSNEKPWTRVHSDLQRGDAAYFKTLTHESVACSRDNTGKQRALSCPTSGKNDNEMTINLDFRLQEYQALKISRRYYIHIFPATLHTSRFFLIFQSFASSSQICNPLLSFIRNIFRMKFSVSRLMFRSKPTWEWKLQIIVAIIFSQIVLITVFKCLKRKRGVSFEFQFARLRGILCKNIKNKIKREVNFSMLTGRNEEFGSLKKKDINGFSRRGIPFVQGGIILCKRDANRHVADSEKVTIAGLTSRKQNERGGIKRNDNNRRKLEIRNPAQRKPVAQWGWIRL